MRNVRTPDVRVAGGELTSYSYRALWLAATIQNALRYVLGAKCDHTLPIPPAEALRSLRRETPPPNLGLLLLLGREDVWRDELAVLPRRSARGILLVV